MIQTEKHESRVFSTLVCRRHVDMALDCLGSLQRFCRQPVQFRIHDDGSLTDREIELLCERLAPVTVIRRAEADERMGEVLRGYEGARLLRERLPLALKLFDTVLLGDADTYAYVDSDVLFLRPVNDPAALPDESTNAVFMEDRDHCYSLRSWQLACSPRVALPSRVNTGLVCLRRACYDLDLLDWFVRKRMHAAIPNMVEQTAWALLGQRVGCRKFDPRQVRVMRDGEAADELVAGHFTARTRHLLPQFVQRARRADVDAAAVTIATVPAGTCTSLDIGAFEARRLAARMRSVVWRPKDCRGVGGQPETRVGG